jgi:hypothetical protein
VPSNELIDPDPGNNATFCSDGYTVGIPYYRTEAGAHENSDSPYGTFDQSGNVWEWNEAIISGAYRGLRGGSFNFYYDNLPPGARYSQYPALEYNWVGVRVSEVPEPGTMAILTLGGLVILRRRNRVGGTAQGVQSRKPVTVHGDENDSS